MERPSVTCIAASPSFFASATDSGFPAILKTVSITPIFSPAAVAPRSDTAAPATVPMNVRLEIIESSARPFYRFRRDIILPRGDLT